MRRNILKVKYRYNNSIKDRLFNIYYMGHNFKNSSRIIEEINLKDLG